jgi:hypothetical protein
MPDLAGARFAGARRKAMAEIVLRVLYYGVAVGIVVALVLEYRGRSDH